MAFFEHRLSDAISRGSAGGPVWKTSKATLSDGRRAVNREWQAPLHRYDISYGIKTEDDFEEVRALFYNVYGAFDGFRFKDWADFRATKQNSTLTLISGSNWQLQRQYTVGARSFKRDIVKPLSGAVVYRTRSGVESVAVAVVNETTGVAAITGHAGGDTYTWVGEFDVPVAFVDDALDNVEVTGNWQAILHGLPSIKLEEIREWS